MTRLSEAELAHYGFHEINDKHRPNIIKSVNGHLASITQHEPGLSRHEQIELAICSHMQNFHIHASPRNSATHLECLLEAFVDPEERAEFVTPFQSRAALVRRVARQVGFNGAAWDAGLKPGHVVPDAGHYVKMWPLYRNVINHVETTPERLLFKR